MSQLDYLMRLLSQNCINMRIIWHWRQVLQLWLGAGEQSDDPGKFWRPACRRSPLFRLMLDINIRFLSVCVCVCPPVLCPCPFSSSAASQSDGSDAAGRRRTSSHYTCRYPSADAPAHTHAAQMMSLRWRMGRPFSIIHLSNY